MDQTGLVISLVPIRHDEVRDHRDEMMVGLIISLARRMNNQAMMCVCAPTRPGDAAKETTRRVV